jgi:hypothetical protein
MSMPNNIVIPPLESIKPTTITAVVKLDATVNTDAAFRMLPPVYLDKVNICEPRPGKRAKPPIVNIPGAIITMVYKGFKRGLILSDTAKSFPHTITIDISVGEKNVNLKLSPSTMHLCGAKKSEHIVETTNHISTYLRRIQDLIAYTKANPERTKAAFDWLLSVVKYENGEVSVTQDIPDSEYALSLIKYSLREFSDLEQLKSYMQYILSVDYIASGSFDVVSVDEVMVKRDFIVKGAMPRNLHLARMFDGHKGFMAIYDTGVDMNVEIVRRVSGSKGGAKNKGSRFFIFKIIRALPPSSKSSVSITKIKFTGPGGPESLEVFEDFKCILTANVEGGSIGDQHGISDGCRVSNGIADINVATRCIESLV